MREGISKAYIDMIASAAGLTVGTWNQDFDGVDTTLQSSVDFSPDRYGPKIDVQLKCTGQEALSHKDHISWALDTRTLEKLSKRNRSTPALLCVLKTAADYWDWLHLDAAGLLAKSHMYWLWGYDLPALRQDQKSQTVHLPLANVLTPAAILQLMEEASRWQPILN